jgi:hypothetical protein
MVPILNPDKIMNEMQNLPNPPYDQIMEFIRKEASSFIYLKSLIDETEDYISFMNNLDKMVELSNNIRTKSLDTMFNSFKIYQFKKKKTMIKLRAYIKR